MYRAFKFLHFIGLSLFLGSIWVYIAQGTPMETPLITQYVRLSVFHLIKTLTLPGLTLMIISGFGILYFKRQLLQSRFFKIKLIGAMILFINSIFILYIAKNSAISASSLPMTTTVLHSYLVKETIFGAVNVLIILFLIGYSVSGSRFSSKKG